MKMLIGLTGKSGSGKTTAARILTELGAFVADCDIIAHKVLEEDTVKEKLCKNFGKTIFNSDGSIDRKALGSIVFSDSEKLAVLNGIVHGAITKKAIDMCTASGKDICFIDGSELEASGVDKKCAHIVVIYADEDIRLNRITERDKISKDSALLRIKAQKDYSKKAIIIKNNGDYDKLKLALTDLYNQFLGEINV
ncbi:MAG: dephospho-CoA kinase [Clostridia bacterium]|nr:dephospho-CoA kinase [Clostridia bacterium]